MKLSVLQQNLSDALNLVVRAAAKHGSAMPVLQGVQLSAYGSRLELQAQNLTVGMSIPVGASVEREGVCTVNAKLLADLVKKFPPERLDITYTKEDNALWLTCGPYQAELVTYEDEFPAIPDWQGDEIITLDAIMLRQAIERVRFAASDDESRPLLNGVFWRINDGVLTLAATDGNRLAVARLDELYSDAVTQFILPAPALAELSRLLAAAKDEEDDVELHIDPDGNHVGFDTAIGSLVCQLIEGNFPDYERIIPSHVPIQADLSAYELKQAVEAAQVILARDNAILKLDLMAPAPNEHALLIQAENSERGELMATLDVDIRNGEDLTVRLNAAFLADYFDHVGGYLRLEASDSKSAVLFRQPANNDYLYVVMPMTPK